MELDKLAESLKGKKINLSDLTLESLMVGMENKALLHTLLDYQIEILSKLRNEDVVTVKQEVDDKFANRFKEFSEDLLNDVNAKSE